MHDPWRGSPIPAGRKETLPRAWRVGDFGCGDAKGRREGAPRATQSVVCCIQPRWRGAPHPRVASAQGCGAPLGRGFFGAGCRANAGGGATRTGVSVHGRAGVFGVPCCMGARRIAIPPFASSHAASGARKGTACRRGSNEAATHSRYRLFFRPVCQWAASLLRGGAVDGVLPASRRGRRQEDPTPTLATRGEPHSSRSERALCESRDAVGRSPGRHVASPPTPVDPSAGRAPRCEGGPL